MDALGASVPVGAFCAATGQSYPLVTGLVVGAAWPLTEALRKRYVAASPEVGGAVLPVVRDWLVMLGALAVLCVALRIEIPTATWISVLLPCLVLTATSRRLLYRWVPALRRRARAVRRVLVVGEANAIGTVVTRLGPRTDSTYRVVGGCVIGDGTADTALPVADRLLLDGDGRATAGDTDAILKHAADLDADLVFLIPCPRLTGERARQLAWALYDDGRGLAVVPGLIDVAPHRVRPAEVAGLAVVHIEPAAWRGAPAVLKWVIDRAGALLLLALLTPVFAAVAVAIRLSSPGPVFYRQIRVGRDREPFRMWKFRTMVAAADRMRPALESANEHDGVMFKMRQDPRVTPLGRFLRRSSLDELPQLYNVLAGHMSLVGPRPPLPEEVERYDETELRRLSVKPGLTGLWQVSGRSDLSWEETVALDLRYVDNWSPSADVDVLARTLRAVVDGRGAY